MNTTETMILANKLEQVLRELMHSRGDASTFTTARELGRHLVAAAYANPTAVEPRRIIEDMADRREAHPMGGYMETRRMLYRIVEQHHTAYRERDRSTGQYPDSKDIDTLVDIDTLGKTHAIVRQEMEKC